MVNIVRWLETWALFLSGREIFNGRTDNEDDAPTLRPMMSRPSSLEETLMLGKILGRRRGNKRMRLWDGITYTKDMNLRKLQEIVKGREACFVAKHVITKSQTWLSNWTIPMRTQGPVNALVLVGVEKDLFGRWGFPSSGAGPWIQGKEHKSLNVLPSIVFWKAKFLFCRKESFDWVCSLDFTEGCRRDLEWDESAKTRWPGAAGWGLW